MKVTKENKERSEEHMTIGIIALRSFSDLETVKIPRLGVLYKVVHDETKPKSLNGLYTVDDNLNIVPLDPSANLPSIPYRGETKSGIFTRLFDRLLNRL